MRIIDKCKKQLENTNGNRKKGVFNMNTGKSEHVWRDRIPSNFGLANLISNKLGEHEWKNPGIITNIRNAKELLLACDYSGFDKSSKYESYVFLAANITEGWYWNLCRENIRSTMLTNGRHISFKGSRGRNSLKILNECLKVSNHLPGVLFCFLFDKRIGRLLSAKPHPFKFPELIYFERGWNMRSFDRLSLVAHLGALIVCGLCGKKHDILWITDRDEIAPNPKKHDHAGWVLWYYLSKYEVGVDGRLIFVTTEADLGKRNIEDVVSIADLSAGALAKALSASETQKGSHSDIFATPVSNRFEERTRIVLRWLAEGGFPLSKLTIILRCKDKNEVQIKIGSPSMFLNFCLSDSLFIY
jgi:hypothetical protein